MKYQPRPSCKPISNIAQQTTLLSGTVDDCCVDYSTVDTATKSSFMPLLKQLQKRCACAYSYCFVFRFVCFVLYGCFFVFVLCVSFCVVCLPVLFCAYCFVCCMLCVCFVYVLVCVCVYGVCVLCFCFVCVSRCVKCSSGQPIPRSHASSSSHVYYTRARC